MLKKIAKLMRVPHYIKNILIFVALACSGQLLDHGKFLSDLRGFFAFCMISSAVYIINDIRDREKDRQHPTKCKRPIASGEISVQLAVILAGAAIVLAAILNGTVFHLPSTLLLMLYFLLNLGYSLGLKNIPFVDVCILVSGFLIRVVYGAIITGIEVSNWLYLTIISISFYLAFGKRRNEMIRLQGKDTREVLRKYSVSFLDKNMYMCLALANMFYALWSMEESAAAGENNKYLIYTVPIVLLITMKYSSNVEGDSDGDPVEVLLRDKQLIALCVIYALVMLFIFYL